MSTHTDPPLLGQLIGGEWRASADTLEDLNPARPQEVVARFARGTASDVADAFAAARQAASAWRHTPAPARGEILFAAARLLSERAEAIGEEVCRENGKPLAEAVGEVRRAAQITRYYAGECTQEVGEVYPSADAHTMIFTTRRPLGVVGIITPWNFPIAIPAWKLVPALAYGNAVVLKPADLTPVGAIRLAEALDEAGLPAGVLNLVTGLVPEIGDAFVDSAEMDALSFTGSPPVGRALQQRVVGRGVKVQLELGGKNPVIVMADADLDFAVEQTLRGGLSQAGQKCTATSRVIVAADARADFAQRLQAGMQALSVGDPLTPGVQMGPLISESQRERVLGYLDLAAGEGQTPALGGRHAPVPDGGGHFVAPTLYTGVDPDSTLGQEEIFGPVLGLVEVNDLDRALVVANDVRYGLSASIFTRDLRAVMAAVRDLDVGILKVNGETAGVEPHAPFGGMKESSSHSREQGKAARDFYTDIVTVYLTDR